MREACRSAVWKRLTTGCVFNGRGTMWIGIFGMLMQGIHSQCVRFAEQKRDVNYVVGANIAGFRKVAEAMLEQGILQSNPSLRRGTRKFVRVQSELRQGEELKSHDAHDDQQNTKYPERFARFAKERHSDQGRACRPNACPHGIASPDRDALERNRQQSEADKHGA